MTTDHRDAGFTLVEILVVLAILALAGGVAVSGLNRGRSQFLLATSAHEATVQLKSERLAAMAAARSMAVTIDEGRNVMRRGDGRVIWSAPAGILVSGAGIVFHPDGTSTGGTVSVRRGSARSTVIVDALTGLARVQ